jgi:hypothetical protein
MDVPMYVLKIHTMELAVNPDSWQQSYLPTLQEIPI